MDEELEKSAQAGTSENSSVEETAEKVPTEENVEDKPVTDPSLTVDTDEKEIDASPSDPAPKIASELEADTLEETADRIMDRVGVEIFKGVADHEKEKEEAEAALEKAKAEDTTAEEMAEAVGKMADGMLGALGVRSKMPIEKEAPPAGMEGLFGEMSDFFTDVAEKHSYYDNLLSSMADGTAHVEVRKRYMLRAIDEAWVNVVEDSLTSLDNVVRNPRRYIEQLEEILPIELSRHISSRSIQHLSQHTNFIADIDGDDITPSKILNVFNDETLQTYENKFVNTLLLRLYIFVSRRYDVALKEGNDEKNTTLTYEHEFTEHEKSGKILISMQVSEKPKNGEVLKNYTYTTDLWRRVQKLYEVCNSYMSSEFVRDMGKSYIRPPVMRTNAILKNRDLRQCLTLWQFIEGYEDSGCDNLVEESLETLDERYVEQLYRGAAAQYAMFRYNVQNDFDDERTLAHNEAKKVLSPKFKFSDELEELTDEDFDSIVEEGRKYAEKRQKAIDEGLIDENGEVVYDRDGNVPGSRRVGEENEPSTEKWNGEDAAAGARRNPFASRTYEYREDNRVIPLTATGNGVVGTERGLREAEWETLEAIEVALEAAGLGHNEVNREYVEPDEVVKEVHVKDAVPAPVLVPVIDEKRNRMQVAPNAIIRVPRTAEELLSDLLIDWVVFSVGAVAGAAVMKRNMEEEAGWQYKLEKALMDVCHIKDKRAPILGTALIAASLNQKTPAARVGTAMVGESLFDPSTARILGSSMAVASTVKQKYGKKIADSADEVGLNAAAGLNKILMEKGLEKHIPNDFNRKRRAAEKAEKRKNRKPAPSAEHVVSVIGKGLAKDAVKGVTKAAISLGAVVDTFIGK